MTYHAVASADKERHEKALHHEIARAHFSHGAEHSDPLSKTWSHNMMGHYDMTHKGNPHMKGMSSKKKESIRDRAKKIVGSRQNAIFAKVKAEHGAKSSDLKEQHRGMMDIKEHVGRKNRDLGRHHANESGVGGPGPHVPFKGKLFDWFS